MSLSWSFVTGTKIKGFLICFSLIALVTCYAAKKKKTACSPIIGDLCNILTSLGKEEVFIPKSVTV